LETPTTGTICIDGKSVAGLPSHKRNLALVFQRHCLMPHLTVGNNLGFGLRMQSGIWSRLAGFNLTGMPTWLRESHKEASTRQKRVLEVARLLGLEDVLDRLPRQLSGGQQQRTALGKALARKPGLFLLDEPLSSLDAALRAEIRGHLHLLHEQLPATMIYVTHDQHEALTLGQRIFVLDQGVLHQSGTPAEVFHRPGDRFVAGFLGWPPMNFLPGRLVRQGEEIVFAGQEFSLPLPPVKKTGELAYLGREMILGIRPEDLRVETSDRPLAAVPMEVQRVESAVHDAIISLVRGRTRVVARVAHAEAVVGHETAMVGFDMTNIHFFDAKTGLRLGVSDPAG
jgi:multiple sugar transport system ATP-binding protein